MDLSFFTQWSRFCLLYYRLFCFSLTCFFQCSCTFGYLIYSNTDLHLTYSSLKRDGAPKGWALFLFLIDTLNVLMLILACPSRFSVLITFLPHQAISRKYSHDCINYEMKHLVTKLQMIIHVQLFILHWFPISLKLYLIEEVFISYFK